jgi:Protein of unknown function (DUF3999)
VNRSLRLMLAAVFGGAAIGGAALDAAAAAAPPLGPEDFAYGMPIVVSEEATAYRFAIPLDVYRGVADEGLADIRVFNAQGEVVPYAVRERDAPPAAPPPAQALPLFPLHRESHLVIDGVHLTIDSPDSSVHLQTQRDHGTAGATAEQYVIDGRGLSLAVAALELDWPDTAAEFSGRMRVDASDDLNNWRTVVGSAPVANLHANGQELIERRIEVPRANSRYWRLSWIGAAPPFELSAVRAQPADGAAQVERAELDVSGVPDPTQPNDTLFDLGTRLRVERINLLLPEMNTVIAVDLQSRARPQDAWRGVTRAGFYRLKTTAGEQSNGPIAIGANHDRYWRAHAAANASPGHGPMRLQAFWTPSEIVFLARGNAPYQLVYGNAAVGAAEADLASIPAAVPVASAAAGPSHVLGGAARLTRTPAPFPKKRALLWAILLAGVCILALMAYRLIKDGAKAGDPQ